MRMLEHFLHRFVAFRIIPRQLQCSRARHTGYQFTPLESRSLIRVSGPDSLPFLQGLITNDIQKLKTQPSLYTLFLNQAGRVLFDSIIYKSSTLNTLLIEADSHVCQTLIRHLKLYRVRRKVEIDDASSELKPWVVWNPSHTDIPPSLRQIDTSSSPSKTTDSLGAEKSLNLNIEKIEGIRDPRLEALGWRVLLPPTQRDIESKSVHLERSCEVTYKTLLYGLGVGEGCVDFPIGSSFPLESNVDFLHGVSFEKGCYIGQELTARTYHTGVVRKRLMPFRILDDAEISEEVEISSLQLLNQSAKPIAKVRNIVNSYGLALTRIQEAMGSSEIKLGRHLVELKIPTWWPVGSVGAVTKVAND